MVPSFIRGSHHCGVCITAAFSTRRSRRPNSFTKVFAKLLMLLKEARSNSKTEISALSPASGLQEHNTKGSAVPAATSF